MLMKQKLFPSPRSSDVSMITEIIPCSLLFRSVLVSVFVMLASSSFHLLETGRKSSQITRWSDSRRRQSRLKITNGCLERTVYAYNYSVAASRSSSVLCRNILELVLVLPSGDIWASVWSRVFSPMISWHQEVGACNFIHLAIVNVY